MLVPGKKWTISTGGGRGGFKFPSVKKAPVGPASGFVTCLSEFITCEGQMST